MGTIHLGFVDYLILAVYIVFVLAIGFVLKRYMKTSTDFFLSGRAIPAWITALAFVSANLGANEVIGMGACGAKYGMITCHFYWIGAICAMVFVGVFMMPFYYGSKARSVPEYLKLRFDEKTRGFNAFSFAVMTIFPVGHLDVRAVEALADAPRLAVQRQPLGLGGRGPGLHHPRRPNLGHLQRSPPVLPHFSRLPAAGHPRTVGHGRLVRPEGQARRGCRVAWVSSKRLDERLDEFGLPRSKPHAHRVVRHGLRVGVCACLWLLVHRLLGRAAGDGRGIDVRRATNARHRHHPEDLSFRPS